MNKVFLKDIPDDFNNILDLRVELILGDHPDYELFDAKTSNPRWGYILTTGYFWRASDDTYWAYSWGEYTIESGKEEFDYPSDFLHQVEPYDEGSVTKWRTVQ